MSDKTESWLHRIWTFVRGMAEALDYNPIEEMAGRLERLEREIAARKDKHSG